MALSRPVVNALSFYFGQLYEHPIRTKSVTSALIAVAGNYASQKIAGSKELNYQSLFAYGGYALLFGGWLPHYFYNFLETVVPPGARFALVRKLILERLIYAPATLAIALYVIARLEGKDHVAAIRQTKALYWVLLTSSWKYLTVLQVLNVSVVPPMLRVLTANLVGFFWTIYVATLRRKQQAKSKPT